MLRVAAGVKLSGTESHEACLSCFLRRACLRGRRRFVDMLMQSSSGLASTLGSSVADRATTAANADNYNRRGFEKGSLKREKA